MRLNSAAAMGERTTFCPQANSTDCGCATIGAAIAALPLALPVQHGDEREQVAGGVEIDSDLVLEALDQEIGALVVQRAPAHVDRLDLARARGADRLVIAVADDEVVLDDALERGERQMMGDDRLLVGGAHLEHEPVAHHREMQPVGPAVVPDRLERVLFEEVVDRDRALVLDVGAGAADRALVDGHLDEAAIFGGSFRVHCRLSRIATDRAWALRPSASPSAIAAGPSAAS